LQTLYNPYKLKAYCVPYTAVFPQVVAKLANHNTFPQGVVHWKTSAVKGIVQCGQAVFFRSGRPHFWCKNFGFSFNLWCVRTDKGERRL